MPLGKLICINNLIEDWEDNENVYDYLTRMQIKNNIIIWFYKRSTDGFHYGPQPKTTKK